MRNLVLFTLFLFIAGSAKSQSKPKEWPEMKAFHSVMSTTFHPSEEGDLQPIKTRSGELVQKSKEWMKSSVPEGYQKKGLKKKLKLLYNECVALDKLVKSGGTDEQIKKALSALHDRFHQIVEICNDHHGEDGHNH